MEWFWYWSGKKSVWSLFKLSVHTEGSCHIEAFLISYLAVCSFHAAPHYTSTTPHFYEYDDGPVHTTKEFTRPSIRERNTIMILWLVGGSKLRSGSSLLSIYPRTVPGSIYALIPETYTYYLLSASQLHIFTLYILFITFYTTFPLRFVLPGLVRRWYVRDSFQYGGFLTESFTRPLTPKVDKFVSFSLFPCLFFPVI